jgi:hypothetical protein
MKTIQELILGVQDRISLPLDDDDRWSTTALVRAFNAALDDKLTPDLVSEGSNYLVHRDVIALTVNGIPAYPLNSVPINKRAVGRALREVKYLPAGKTKIEDELNCPAISLEEKDMFSSESDVLGSSVPYVFLENDSLRLVGGDLAGSIVMYYSLEPSFLLDPTTSVTPSVPVQYATITAWTTTITATAASAWDTYQATGTTKFVDIYRKTTGAILKANVQMARSGTTYTITGLSDDEINQIKAHQPGGFPISGPYESELLLLPAGQSEFSTIPYEFDQLLILYACERVLESIGDTEGLQVVMAKIKETRDSISRVTGNRLQGERRKLTDRRSIARIQRGQKWTRSYIKNYT